MSTDIPDILKSMKHFLSIRDVGFDALAALTDFSIQRKQEFKRGDAEPRCQGRVLAMIFQKASLRTRLGFEAAMAQLGGHAINLEDRQIGISSREDVRDVARVISSMCDAIVARVHAHHVVIELAAHSSVPVVNGLSDWAHPCQALSDLMTIKEHFGGTAGRKLAFIGDGNNVARSLLNTCAGAGMHFAIASPPGYGLDDGLLEWAGGLGQKHGIKVAATTEPAEAVVDADVVYTDVWTSMGQEAERVQREEAFAAYQVTMDLVARAKPTAVVMHCLPAYRNLEIASEVVDSPQSLIFQQAENRLHSQRALLEVLLGREKSLGAG